MKIEFEIRDIERGEVIEAMARQILTVMVKEHDPEYGANEYPDRSELAKLLAKGVGQKIERLAAEAVREHFDATIKARIESTVDEVLAEGWRKTDSYGNATGDRVDLKGRINEVITTKVRDGYSGPQYTLSEKLVADSVKEVMTSGLKHELEAARKSLRDQLDTAVTAKVAATIKEALGLR